MSSGRRGGTGRWCRRLASLELVDATAEFGDEGLGAVGDAEDLAQVEEVVVHGLEGWCVGGSPAVVEAALGVQVAGDAELGEQLRCDAVFLAEATAPARQHEVRLRIHHDLASDPPGSKPLDLLAAVLPG